MKIVVLNGPNLNLLGTREPAIYGTNTLADIQTLCERWGADHGHDIQFYQSNHEGALIDAVHESRGVADGIVINPAGFTFTSVALLDALKSFDGTKIELHLANIHQREDIYHDSLVSRTATAVICGLGIVGYKLALDAIESLDCQT